MKRPYRKSRTGAGVHRCPCCKASWQNCPCPSVMCPQDGAACVNHCACWECAAIRNRYGVAKASHK